MRVDPIHCHIDNVSRLKEEGGERSVVAKAAYNAGVTLWNEREQKVTNFAGRQDVIFTALVAPEGAPAWVLDRGQLWNKVDMTARRRDARLAKSIDAALPRAIPRDHWPAIAMAYANLFVAQGMVADVAIHEDGTEHNPHVHVLLTVNALKPEGFASKLTLVDTKGFVTLARTGWQNICNDALAASGAALRVDARSYRTQGIDKTPTKHRGPNAVERRARRANARQIREEVPMSREPSAFERYSYPLLTQRPDWPLLDDKPPHDLTVEERSEFDRYQAVRREQANRAVEQTIREDRLPQWLEERTNAQRGPELSLGSGEEPRPLDAELVPGERWQQPSLDDFRRDPLLEELREQRVTYEKDLWDRAVNMHRTKREDELIKRAEAVSPEMAKQVKEVLLDRRIAHLREQDDAARLERFEARLGPALREPFEDYAREAWPERDREPVPGPDHELTSPSDLAHAQERMLEEYEREPEDRDR